LRAFYKAEEMAKEKKKPKKRLKSTSKDGQSLESRAKESKGARKKELDKLSRVDKENYQKAPASVQQKIREDYAKGKKKKKKTKNQGKYI
jgi:hypothetical protein